MNWLGDRFEDEEELVLLEILSKGLEVFRTEAGFEVVSYKTIPAKNIIAIIPI